LIRVISQVNFLEIQILESGMNDILCNKYRPYFSNHFDLIRKGAFSLKEHGSQVNHGSILLGKAGYSLY
jgi:hypothetical protein